MTTRGKEIEQPVIVQYLCSKFQTLTNDWVEQLVSHFPTATVELLIKYCTERSIHINDDIVSQLNNDTSNEQKYAMQLHDTTFKTRYKFKEIRGRLIGCNGDCGSKLSMLIDYIAHHQDRVM